MLGPSILFFRMRALEERLGKASPHLSIEYPRFVDGGAKCTFAEVSPHSVIDKSSTTSPHVPSIRIGLMWTIATHYRKGVQGKTYSYGAGGLERSRDLKFASSLMPMVTLPTAVLISKRVGYWNGNVLVTVLTTSKNWIFTAL